jgi:hypothetical protein
VERRHRLRERLPGEWIGHVMAPPGLGM